MRHERGSTSPSCSAAPTRPCASSPEPQAVRRAEPLTLAGGRDVAAGDEVVIDLMAANRDPAAFGPDADAFDPHRALPAGRGPPGAQLRARHARLHRPGARRRRRPGLDVAAGAERLYGLVPVAVRPCCGRRPARSRRPTPPRPHLGPGLLVRLPGALLTVAHLGSR